MKAKTTFSISILILACCSVFYNRCEAQQGWNIQDILEPSYKFTSIFFVDANSGYIAVSSGIIYKTFNYGTTIIPSATNTGCDIKSIYFINYDTGFAAGHNINTTGNNGVLMTKDAGVHWTFLISSNNGTYNNIHFLNYQTGFIGGNNSTSMLKTTNGA